MEGANTDRNWCVFNGWVPGVYTTKEDMRFQIDGFDGSSWTACDSYEAAEDAWVVFFGQGSRDVRRCRLQSGDAPPMFQPPERRERERMAVTALRTAFAEEKKRFPDNPQGRLCVPPRPRPPPLVTVSMRALLRDACNKLDMPAPIYRGMMCTDPDGRRRFRDIVSLVLPGSTQALVVVGRIADDPDSSWEEAAKAGLRIILRGANSTVEDYNYQIVQRWKEKYVQNVQTDMSLQTAAS